MGTTDQHAAVVGDEALGELMNLIQRNSPVAEALRVFNEVAPFLSQPGSVASQTYYTSTTNGL